MIKYDLDIYPIDIIKKAADDYSSLAVISMCEEDGYCLCSFSDCQYGELFTEKEFSNYLIDMINALGRIT